MLPSDCSDRPQRRDLRPELRPGKQGGNGIDRMATEGLRKRGLSMFVRRLISQLARVFSFQGARSLRGAQLRSGVDVIIQPAEVAAGARLGLRNWLEDGRRLRPRLPARVRRVDGSALGLAAAQVDAARERIASTSARRAVEPPLTPPSALPTVPHELAGLEAPPLAPLPPTAADLNSAEGILQAADGMRSRYGAVSCSSATLCGSEYTTRALAAMNCRSSIDGRLGPRGRGAIDNVPKVHDALYGEIRLTGWVRTLLGTRPFRRLAGISLSDVPGELLFGRPFPSRLDHALGVYYLTRLARPRDRILQAAALAHDLGHGPFSHLTEPLLREQDGEDHEQRSARFLVGVQAELSPEARQQLSWLDWDEAARLIVAGRGDGRGELLNGRLDYDNIDNVARFLLASGLGNLSYDPATLAPGLRLLPARSVARLTTIEGEASAVGRGRPGQSLGPPSWTSRVILHDGVLAEARGWQADRATVYAYLHEGHANLVLHATLRKVIDLALQAGALPRDFLDLSDGEALLVLRSMRQPGITRLMQAVSRTGQYHCDWELEVRPGSERQVRRDLLHWRDRLAVEERLATEAALMPHEVIVEAIASSATRPLPPIAVGGMPSELTLLPTTQAAPARIHVFTLPGIPRDYARRLSIAAERYYGNIGTVIRSAAG